MRYPSYAINHVMHQKQTCAERRVGRVKTAPHLINHLYCSQFHGRNGRIPRSQVIIVDDLLIWQRKPGR